MSNITENKKQNSTSIAERFAYISFPLGTNFISMLIMTFIPLYYTDNVGLSTATVATLFLITKIGFAFGDPLLGGFIDKINTKKSKFKPWLSFTIILAPITTILLFITVGENSTIKIIYTYFSYILCGVLGITAGIPHTAMATTMTENLSERTRLMSRSMLTGIIGSVVVGVLGGPMISKLGYKNSGYIIAFFAFITMFPLHFLVKERVLHPPSKDYSFKKMINAITKNRNLIALSVSFLFVVGTSFATSIGAYFVQWNLGNLELMGVVMICTFIPVIALPIVLPLLINKIGKRKLYIYALILAISISILQYIIGYSNLVIFLIINAIKVIGIYLPVMLLNLFLADCCEYSAYYHKERNQGLIFSIGSLANKLGGAIAGSLPVFLLGLFGYVSKAEVQVQSAIDGIWMLMSILPVAGLLVALIIFAKFYKLEEKDVQLMIDKMDEMDSEIILSS